MCHGPRQDRRAAQRHDTSWFPVGSVLQAGLAATFLLVSGLVPQVELQHVSASSPAVGQTIVMTELGVPGAHAMSFNDEQRAIAETWVSVGWHRS